MTETGVYRAGSSVLLTCQASEGSPPLMYFWNSTCVGSCFALEETTQSVQESALHSGDSGIHTCSVTDYVGHSGTASIQITVSGNKESTSFCHVTVITYCLHLLGVSLFLEGTGQVRNNSIILASVTGRFNQVQCISGSTSVNVGQWIAPNGDIINGGTSGSFVIVTGDGADPGFTSIELRTGVSLTARDEGIYTCVIPDENGNLQYLYTGIYLQGFNSKQTNGTLRYFTIGMFATCSLTSDQLATASIWDWCTTSTQMYVCWLTCFDSGLD